MWITFIIKFLSLNLYDLAGINVKVELDVHASDQTYLHHLRNKLPNALDHFKPDIVVYNAGLYVYI